MTMGESVFLFFITTKLYQFKAKDSEIKKYPLCLGNISGDFLANNMKEIGLNRCVYGFSVFLIELLILVILLISINI